MVQSFLPLVAPRANVMKPRACSHRLSGCFPLAYGVVLGLCTVPAPALMARELTDEAATIGPEHPIEEWLLNGQSALTVNAGSTRTIRAFGTSMVVLNRADVSRDPLSFGSYAMQVHENAVATVTGSRFDTALWAESGGRIELTGSSIDVPPNPSPDDVLRSPWGLSLSDATSTGRPSVLLDSSSVRVAEQGREHINNPYGISSGAFVRAGELTLRNASSIRAANTAVVAEMMDTLDHPVDIILDHSHIASGRGPGILFLANREGSNTLNVLVANGSTIQHGDGNLLLVRALFNAPLAGDNHINFTVDDSRLAGNIFFDSRYMMADVNVLLRNRASLTGNFTFNIATVGIHDNSTWTLTGASYASRMSLGATGTVALSNDGAFNQLLVDYFTGEGGTLAFRSVLEGDTSDTDRLEIFGDANGSADVTVTNAGGHGAQTERGIPLIRVHGQSNATFLLQGRAVGGPYDYFLVKDPDGSWYLRSTLPAARGNDPTDPGRSTPVLRPETGAYLAQQAALGSLLQYAARDRGPLAATDGVLTWARVDHGNNRMDATGKQRLRTQQSRLQIGAGLPAFGAGQGQVGALLSAGRAEVTSRSTVTGYRARGKVEGGAAGVYANWSNGTLYVDGSVQYGRFRNEVLGEAVAQERDDSRAWQTSIEAGYRFNAGRIGGMQLSVEPQLQLTHTAASMDTHVESSGTVVADAGGKGLSTRVGLRLEGEAATGNGRFLPYLAFDAHHAAKDVAVSFDGEVLEGGMPRRRVDLQLGGQLVLGGGLSAWGGVGASHGTDNYRDTHARVGMSYQW